MGLGSSDLKDPAIWNYGHTIRIHSKQFDPSGTGDHMDNICIGRVYSCRVGEAKDDKGNEVNTPYVTTTPYGDVYKYPGEDDARAAVKKWETHTIACEASNIAKMIQKYGDAALSAYRQEHKMDIKVDLRLVDCEGECECEEVARCYSVVYRRRCSRCSVCIYFYTRT